MYIQFSQEKHPSMYIHTCIMKQPVTLPDHHIRFGNETFIRSIFMHPPLKYGI